MRLSRMFRLAGAALGAAMLGPAAMADTADRTLVYGRLVYDVSAWQGEQAQPDETGGEFRQVLAGVLVHRGAWTFHTNALTATGFDPDIFDAWAEYHPGGGVWGVKVGQFKTPNSLDEQSSTLALSMVERTAFTDAFAFDRRLGAALVATDDRFTLTAGLFAANINDTPFSEGNAQAARVTVVPWQSGDWSSHLGLSVRWREGGEDLPLLHYRQRPFVHQSGAILSAGTIARRDRLIGLEGALFHGDSWLTSEYASVAADLSSGGTAAFGGGYVEAGHIFGGHRLYRYGRFERVTAEHPVENGGSGAFEIAARLDTLDLTDPPVDGGRLTTGILALTWIPSRHLEIALNLFHADAALGSVVSGLDPAFAEAVATGLSQDSVDGTTLRFQASF